MLVLATWVHPGHCTVDKDMLKIYACCALHRAAVQTTWALFAYIRSFGGTCRLAYAQKVLFQTQHTLCLCMLAMAIQAVLRSALCHELLLVLCDCRLLSI